VNMAKVPTAPFNVPKIDLYEFISVCPCILDKIALLARNRGTRAVSVDTPAMVMSVRQKVMWFKCKVVSCLWMPRTAGNILW